jgi:CheY-like chemotaxis protein
MSNQVKKDSRLILVVDDNSSLREALAAVLENSGYEVVQASEGHGAIALTRQHPVALLITDLIMPGEEGIETIRNFAKEFPHIPIIAISGNPDYLSWAQLLGAAAVLTKPIGHTDLLRAVRNLID